MHSFNGSTGAEDPGESLFRAPWRDIGKKESPQVWLFFAGLFNFMGSAKQ